MATTVRARRLTSPPPPPPSLSPASSSLLSGSSKYNYHDADAKRAAASLGLPPGKLKHYPPGGFDITSAEWKLLFFIVLLALGVRTFRLSSPDSVVYVFTSARLSFFLSFFLTNSLLQVR